jgi:hypothetical protein
MGITVSYTLPTLPKTGQSSNNYRSHPQAPQLAENIKSELGSFCRNALLHHAFKCCPTLSKQKVKIEHICLPSQQNGKKKH